MATKVTKDNTQKMLDSLKTLSRRVVAVGVTADTTHRTPSPGQAKTATNSVIAYTQETGRPEMNVPARPFLYPGVKSCSDFSAETLGVAAKAALSGKAEVVEKALGQVGTRCAEAVREKLTSGPYPALSPQTLAARKARGVQSEQPLVDTGQLAASITYQVRDR